MLSYNGRKIIPAPLVSIVKNYVNTEAGLHIGTTYDITLKGTLLPFKGSPSGAYASIDQAFWNLGGYPPDEVYVANGEDFNHILRKQEAIRWLFSEDGKSLEWSSDAGQPVVKCNPHIVSIDFAEGRGQWAEGTDYTIQLEAAWLYVNGTVNTEDAVATQLLAACSEAWGFDEVAGRDGSGFRVSHNVSARGIVGYDPDGTPYGGLDAWQHASAWVNARASGYLDTALVQAVLGIGTFYGGEYVKTTEINKADGSYSVTENWALQFSPLPFVEKMFTIEMQGDTGEYSVRYNGTVHGFAQDKHSGSTIAATNAKSYLPSAASARTEAMVASSGLIGSGVLPDTPSATSFTINNQDGTIAFSFEWNPTTSGSVTLEYEVTVSYSADEGAYTLSLNQQVTGRGESAVDRLANARGALLADIAAEAMARSLAGSSLPPTVAGLVLKHKSTAVNERRGTVRAEWTWSSAADDSGIDVDIRTVLPSSVYATIPVVGRAAGPVIQNMNTLTSEEVTITVVGTSQTTKPDGATLALTYLTTPSDYLVVNQEESWSAVRGKYLYRAQFLKLT